MINLRAKRIAACLAPYISPGMRVLDFGCGTMRIAHHVAERTGARILGIDVTDTNRTSLHMLIYDGRKLPFPNRSFDVTYAAFVFHHTVHTEVLLAECFRVTRRLFILLEDVYENQLELSLLKLFDVSNKMVDKDMDLPFAFRTESAWKVLLQPYSSHAIRGIPVRPNPIRPTRHRMFLAYRA